MRFHFTNHVSFANAIFISLLSRYLLESESLTSFQLTTRSFFLCYTSDVDLELFREKFRSDVAAFSKVRFTSDNGNI